VNGFEARYFAVSREVVWHSVPATLRVSLTVAHLSAYVFSFLEKRVENFFILCCTNAMIILIIIIRPHRSTYVGAAHCYTDRVSWSVGLSQYRYVILKTVTK